jgi:hypothetical protein
MNKKINIVLIIILAVIVAVGFSFLKKEKIEPAIKTGIVITSPEPGEEISSPLKITGYVNGDGWSGFEGQVGLVTLLDNENKELASAVLTATTEWTSLPTYFETNLEFFSGKDQQATLFFQNENPSGLPEKNKEFRLAINIKKFEGETMEVKAYFNNSQMDPEFSCNKVFSVDRVVPKTQAAARAALEELLKGPTDQEKSQEFFSSINQGVKIQSLTIENGVARVDFDEQLEYQVGGSCMVAAIRAEITQTLEQFSSVKNVIISINGRTEDILQP